MLGVFGEAPQGAAFWGDGGAGSAGSGGTVLKYNLSSGVWQ